MCLAAELTQKGGNNNFYWDGKVYHGRLYKSDNQRMISDKKLNKGVYIRTKDFNFTI